MTEKEAGLAKDAQAYLEGKIDALKEWGLPESAAEIQRDMDEMHTRARRVGICVERRK